MKINVEGFETVMKGMAVTLTSPVAKAIIIELNGSGERYGFKEIELHKLLLSHSFKTFNYDPFKRALTELNTFGNYNTIYCRDLDFITKHLHQATAIKLMGKTI